MPIEVGRQLTREEEARMLAEVTIFRDVVAALAGLPALAFVSTGLLLIPLVMLLKLDETDRRPLPEAVASPLAPGPSVSARQ